jgi:uncharacterized protein with von Willebrand factor type A (vWA) domain
MMQKQLAQMQSLLDSLTPEMRQSLQDLMNAMLEDEDLRDELSELAANLEYLMPMRQFRNRYAFEGEEPLSLSEALKLMEKLQQMDELENELRKAQREANLDNVDRDKLRELLGEEANQTLEQLEQLSKVLEEAGYIRKKGKGYELTPRGIRKIGQKALGDIYAHLKKERFGKHEVSDRGLSSEKADDTKQYEFGDHFLLDLPKTLMNSLQRGIGVPVKMEVDDFEVYQTQYLTECSTVLMLDLSLSMARKGSFLAAKRVALALNNLIRSQFPRDSLYIVGFSTYARELKSESLPYVTWDQFDPYTNIQQGLMVSQKLLSRQKGGNKQIILISDGEPTAHIEKGQLYLGYPPSPRTLQETLREVKRCTRKGIVINTFMLDKSDYLMEFVEQLAKINKGRVFFTTPEKLGEYLLVDYITSKRKRVII